MGEQSQGEPRPSRRRFIGGTASAVVAVGLGAPAWGGATLSGCRPRPDLPDGLFALGVASGDPRPDSVVLWTRLAPAPLAGGGMPAVDVPVAYEVASDEGFRHVVRRGLVKARPRWGHSVHAVVEGLRPDRWYWYRFRVHDEVSPVARTRTTPAPGRGDDLRFLFASCQSWPSGYYTAWQHAPEEDPDLVVHLGDYIYEGGVGSGVRPHNSGEILTLDDYRNRYGLYKGDPALQAIHAACPWVVTWDDHEVENNYAGLTPQDPADVPGFAARRAAAYQAWWEHQPVRVGPPSDENLRIYRAVDWGRLARFHVLDTRQYRDDQGCGIEDLGETCADRTDPARTILGADQERWLGRSLRGSRAVFDVLANQVVMTSMPLAGVLYNHDQWDGYAAARTRLLDQLRAAGPGTNPVVITGDIHASGVGDLIDEAPGATSVGTELVGTSMTSSFSSELADIAEQLIEALPHVRWADTHRRGYVACDVSRTQLVARYRLVDTVAQPTSPIATATTWTVEAGHLGPQEGG
jgi:alkaline phosphatase D